MLCKNPVQFDRHNKEAAFPCGQCIPCRINKRRIWAHRIKLEALDHDSSVFLTLTYDDDRLPVDCGFDPNDGLVYAPHSVMPAHHVKFLKDLRYRLDYPIRFYAVGEYGDLTQRPHYHYALFGYPRCSEGSSYRNGIFEPCRCKHCLLISQTWNKGHIFNGDLTIDSANYIAGYVTKKLTSDKSEFQANILKGRRPEFARMSRMPGLGANAADKISSSLTNYGLLEKDDVPLNLVHGNKALPLGRYLSDKIHEKMGHTYEENERLRTFERSLRTMLIPRKDLSEIAPHYKCSVASALKFLGHQRILDLETKQRLYRKDKKI